MCSRTQKGRPSASMQVRMLQLNACIGIRTYRPHLHSNSLCVHLHRQLQIYPYCRPKCRFGRVWRFTHVLTPGLAISIDCNRLSLILIPAWPKTIDQGAELSSGFNDLPASPPVPLFYSGSESTGSLSHPKAEVTRQVQSVTPLQLQNITAGCKSKLLIKYDCTHISPFWSLCRTLESRVKMNPHGRTVKIPAGELRPLT